MTTPENSNDKMPDTASEENSQRINPEKRHRIKLIAFILITVGLILAIMYFIHASLYQSTDDAFIDGHITQISPQISGNIIQVYVKDN